MPTNVRKLNKQQILRLINLATKLKDKPIKKVDFIVIRNTNPTIKGFLVEFKDKETQCLCLDQEDTDQIINGFGKLERVRP